METIEFVIDGHSVIVDAEDAHIITSASSCKLVDGWEGRKYIDIYVSRMGYHSRLTVHGFRSMASTVLNENGFNRDWVEMQLAHIDGSVRGVYNSADWLPGRRQMLAFWSDFLEWKVKLPAA